jgi:nucleoside-diphosphate-sugar epimerase
MLPCRRSWWTNTKGPPGLVGGYIVLQLLARGQSPLSIRIVDFQKPHRDDMLHGPAKEVGFVKTDVSSASSTGAAFMKPWHPSVAHLPLTVFHTAAVIVAVERSKLVYDFCEAVNVRGTQNVLDAAHKCRADILISTTSGSIGIRPVQFWLPLWELWSNWPRHYCQVLDESDFFQPIRAHHEFFANYAASKAAAERIICDANRPELRTGCIRPVNGVYGNPTDNIFGVPLSSGRFPG